MVAATRQAAGSVAARDLGRVGVDDQGTAIAGNGVFVDDHLLQILQTRQFVHQIEQHLSSWGNEVESNALEVHIHHLRRKLGAGLIQTVRGVGYTLLREGGMP